MKKYAMILAIAALAFISAGVAEAQIEWDEPAKEQTEEKPAQGETEPAATPAQPVHTEESRRVDQTLGIDWGDDKDDNKPEDPNSKQPSTKVDLTTVLDDGQQRRLGIIQKTASEGDELAVLAAKTRAGETRNMPKERCVQQYNLASTKYLKAHNDINNFARPIREEDTRLTLFRQYGDDYRKKAIKMLNEAGHATLEMNNTPAGIRTAVGYFKRARDIDEKDPGWRNGYLAAQSAMMALMEAAQTATSTATGGGGRTEERTYGESERENRKDALDHTGGTRRPWRQ